MAAWRRTLLRDGDRAGAVRAAGVVRGMEPRDPCWRGRAGAAVRRIPADRSPAPALSRTRAADAAYVVVVPDGDRAWRWTDARARRVEPLHAGRGLGLPVCGVRSRGVDGADALGAHHGARSVGRPYARDDRNRLGRSMGRLSLSRVALSGPHVARSRDRVGSNPRRDRGGELRAGARDAILKPSSRDSIP